MFKAKNNTSIGSKYIAHYANKPKDIKYKTTCKTQKQIRLSKGTKKLQNEASLSADK
jgi:hypothetical protein